MPNGQYGTRDVGGKDHAASRYIFTELSPLTRIIYHPADDPLLKYLKDDSSMVEPEWYMPIVPLVLINGAEGIGTGKGLIVSLILLDAEPSKVGAPLSHATIPSTSLPTFDD
jgi:hypothetical protein